jgi:MFS family permease
VIGPFVSASRLADTLGRLAGGWLCDRIGSRHVILLGVFLTVPAFLLQVMGEGIIALLVPLCLMTAGFGFSNVGATTFALQAADDSSKGVALGLIRAATSFGRMFGPLIAGFLVAHFGFEWGFTNMGLISLAIGSIVWALFRKDSGTAASGF